jgi:hypothetical protein
MEVEGEMEKTRRVGQDDLVRGAGQEAAKGLREWKLDGGPYRSRYTRNGRYGEPPSLFICAYCPSDFLKSLYRLFDTFQ